MNPFTVVIPSRNAENVKACIGAIRKSGETCQIILMDDGLGMEWLPRPDLMPTMGHICPKPFVFARNCNFGIKSAGTDDVILLNDDALLQTPGGFTKLAEAAQAYPEYGVMSAAVNNVGNRNQWPGRGWDKPREDPRMVCFVAVYIPRSTIERVGLLDEELTGYGYDDDLYCAHVKAAGLKIGIFDGCFVDHSKLKPTYRSLPNVNALMAHNRAIYARKGGSKDPRLNLTTRRV